MIQNFAHIWSQFSTCIKETVHSKLCAVLKISMRWTNSGWEEMIWGSQIWSSQKFLSFGRGERGGRHLVSTGGKLVTFALQIASFGDTNQGFHLTLYRNDVQSLITQTGLHKILSGLQMTWHHHIFTFPTYFSSMICVFDKSRVERNHISVCSSSHWSRLKLS